MHEVGFVEPGLSNTLVCVLTLRRCVNSAMSWRSFADVRGACADGHKLHVARRI